MNEHKTFEGEWNETDGWSGHVDSGVDDGDLTELTDERPAGWDSHLDSNPLEPDFTIATFDDFRDAFDV